MGHLTVSEQEVVFDIIYDNIMTIKTNSLKRPTCKQIKDHPTVRYIFELVKIGERDGK
jgi:hypothetical protein